MPMYEFGCEKCGKVIEKYVSSYTKATENQEEVLADVTKVCDNSETCQFKLLISTGGPLIDPWKLLGGARKLDSDFKSRMNQIAKNNPTGNVKTYNRGMV